MYKGKSYTPDVVRMECRGWRGDYPWDFTFDFVAQTKELYCHVKAHAKISEVSKPRVKRVQMARTLKKRETNKEKRNRQRNKQKRNKKKIKDKRKRNKKETKKKERKKKRDKCVVFLFH